MEGLIAEGKIVKKTWTNDHDTMKKWIELV
jgi:hypothetical protein